MEIFGDTELRRAGECFSLAGLYKLAANAYARGNFFPECVTVCARGKLFDPGLAHIERWKQQDKKACDVTDRDKEIEKIEQEFLECYALHYYEVNNNKSMMKVVKNFKSMDLIRNFLKQIGCFDELISLEEQWGNFEEAIEISKLKGDELLVADLLGKAGKFKEAATVVLSYVLVNSLWSSGKNGWPLKLFKQKDNLLAKAMLFAKNGTESFYEFVCAEADIMENKKSDLLMKRNQLNASQRHKSLRGEILCARKILDNHLASKFMDYFFEEDLVIDLVKHSEDMISENRVSVESLVYFWKFWQEKLVGVFEYLGCLETQDVCEFESYGDFCLSFLGVRRQFHDQNVIYVLLNPDADWARNAGKRPVWRDGKLVSIDVCEFVSAARVYWTSEVFSVGFKVLHKLEVLYDFVAKKSDALFRKCRNLTLIYEVAAFLLDSKFLKRTSQESEDLQKFIRLSTDDFCSYIFPLDWRKSTTENLTLFRETDFCKNFLKQVIVEYTNPRNNLSSGKIGSIAKVILGSGKLDKELLEKILERMDQNPPWKAFFEILSRSRGTYFPSRSLISRSHEALVDAYEVNSRSEFDRISPGCFLYLVDRLLIWASSYQGYFITTKSSFVEWLIHQEIHSNNTWSSSNASVDLQASLLAAIQFVIGVIKTCLSNKGYMIKWLKRYTSGEGENHSIVVSRMVVMICLLHVNFSMCLDLLFDLLGRSYITEQLPCEFSDCLKPHFLSLNLNVFAEAFKKIDNPLVIVSFGAKCSKFSYPGAILVDMEVHRCKSDIMRQLFSKSSEASEGLSTTASMDSPGETVSTSSSTVGKSSDILHSKGTEFVAEQDNRIPNKHESNFLIKYVCFWEIFECINSHESGIDERKFTSNAQTIKVIHFCLIAYGVKKTIE